MRLLLYIVWVFGVGAWERREMLHVERFCMPVRAPRTLDTVMDALSCC